MRILFVYASLSHLGGIETLIGRLCRRLTAQGHHVTVLLQKSALVHVQDPALLDTVRQVAKVKFVQGWFRAAPQSLHGLELGKFDFIYAFESNSLLLSLVIHQHTNPGARLALGVYHPREYCAYGSKKRYQQQLVEDVLRDIPLQNVFFMNEDAAREHGECLHRDFSASPVIPLAVDASQLGTVLRSVDRRKIVSVGRITNFKTYNFWMLDVIRQLNRSGNRFEYHIYGTGEQSDEVAATITQKELSGTVFMHGNLAYSKFCEVMTDAFVFVGMGTALLEAAACGVPALTAIESSREPLTYGFLPEAKGHNAGEFSPGAETFPAIERIEALAALDVAGYDAQCAASKRSAAKFSVEAVTDDFVSALDRTIAFSYPITNGMRLRDEVDRWLWRLLRLARVEDPYARRYVRVGNR